MATAELTQPMPAPRQSSIQRPALFSLLSLPLVTPPRTPQLSCPLPPRPPPLPLPPCLFACDVCRRCVQPRSHFSHYRLHHKDSSDGDPHWLMCCNLSRGHAVIVSARRNRRGGWNGEGHRSAREQQLQRCNQSMLVRGIIHCSSAPRLAASTSHEHRCSEGKRGLTPRDCTVDAITGAAHFSASLTSTRSPLPSSSLVGSQSQTINEAISHRLSMRQSIRHLSSLHISDTSQPHSRQHVQHINKPAWRPVAGARQHTPRPADRRGCGAPHHADSAPDLAAECRQRSTSTTLTTLSHDPGRNQLRPSS